MSSSDTTSKVGMARLPGRGDWGVRSGGLGDQIGRPDTVRAPGSVPEWPKGAGCKPAAQATLVRIQPGPLLLCRPPDRRAFWFQRAGFRGLLVSEHALHLDHVEPAPELAA